MGKWRERAEQAWLLGNRDVGYGPLLAVLWPCLLLAGLLMGELSDPLRAARFLVLTTIAPFLPGLCFRSLVKCGDLIAKLP